MRPPTSFVPGSTLPAAAAHPPPPSGRVWPPGLRLSVSGPSPPPFGTCLPPRLGPTGASPRNALHCCAAPLDQRARRALRCRSSEPLPRGRSPSPALSDRSARFCTQRRPRKGKKHRRRRRPWRRGLTGSRVCALSARVASSAVCRLGKPGPACPVRAANRLKLLFAALQDSALHPPTAARLYSRARAGGVCARCAPQRTILLLHGESAGLRRLRPHSMHSTHQFVAGRPSKGRC